MNRRIDYLDRLEIVASQNIKEEKYWLDKLSGDLKKSIFPYDFEIEGSLLIRCWR